MLKWKLLKRQKKLRLSFSPCFDIHEIIVFHGWNSFCLKKGKWYSSFSTKKKKHDLPHRICIINYFYVTLPLLESK